MLFTVNVGKDAIHGPGEVGGSRDILGCVAENRPRVHISNVDGSQNIPVPIVAVGAAHNPVNLFVVGSLSGV